MRQNLDEAASFEMVGNASLKSLDHPEPGKGASYQRFGIVHENR